MHADLTMQRWSQDMKMRHANIAIEKRAAAMSFDRQYRENKALRLQEIRMGNVDAAAISIQAAARSKLTRLCRLLVLLAQGKPASRSRTTAAPVCAALAISLVDIRHTF